MEPHRQTQSARSQCLVTVTALVSSGIIDSSLKFHLMEAKKNGITRTEIAEVLTQIGFYAG
jgi:4-carboxymuconolactone decarboxylase